MLSFRTITPKCKFYGIAVAIGFAVAEVGVAKYIVTIFFIRAGDQLFRESFNGVDVSFNLFVVEFF